MKKIEFTPATQSELIEIKRKKALSRKAMLEKIRKNIEAAIQRKREIEAQKSARRNIVDFDDEEGFGMENEIGNTENLDELENLENLGKNYGKKRVRSRETRRD